MKSRFIALSILCWIAVSPFLAGEPAAGKGARQFEEDIKVLASDAMEGRGVGTAGLARAADFIEARLRRIGLQPAFKGSYRQTFPIKTGVALVPGNRLNGVGVDDWIPLGFSSAGSFKGELAFVGYGITAAPIGYDDLAGIDLRGKVALMLRYEPQERDDASPFDGRRPSRWSSIRYRVHQARERGAVAVIFVTGPLQDEEKDKLPQLFNDGPESPAGLPVIQVKTSVARNWLDRVKVNLRSFQENVDRDLTPRSSDRTGIVIDGTVALKNTFAESQNIVGVIPGKGSRANEVVVVGAHYDHLGQGGQGSMRPNVSAIHNGADDNASGTVAVLHAAESLVRTLSRPASHRTVVVALFAGEEVGLAGSSFLVDHFPFPLNRVVAMVNLDMVGRLRENRFVAMGAESAPEWSAALQRIGAQQKIDVTTRGDGYGPSDQTSFYAEGIPVIHFFTGSHEQYHTPDDDPSTVNSEGVERIARFTASVVEELASGKLTPAYARAQSAPAMEGDSRGYGAYLGTVPDYRAMERISGGVLLSDVRPGGPADLAGIRRGDRITEMAGTAISNLYDMSFALQDHKPGETINVVVLRKGVHVTLRATLGDRKTSSSPPPAPPKAPASPATPVMPLPAVSLHDVPPDSSVEFSLPKFYENRPGPKFTIKAGRPYGRIVEGEKHLTAIRQLTFGGENAEAYFSPDGKQLIYQYTGKGGGCDQQFVLDLATGESRRVSSGKGRTTCGYFDWPEADRVIYSSTEAGGDGCPPPPDRSLGYTWAVYSSYDIYEAARDGSVVKRLTSTPGYDAEATWCHRGGRMVFTSSRDGDLDLYEMDEAGNVRRLTSSPGYDGGAFYSPDCSEIVWRASRPAGSQLDEYRKLLSQGLVRPTTLDLFVMKADGTAQRQLTSNGAANFAPYFFPDGKRIIYSSNIGASQREFDLWMISKGGGEPERVTFAEGFDGFPMFSPDGIYLVWGSNRANVESRETNLFIAKWVP